jgi:hypothetical protein
MSFISSRGTKEEQWKALKGVGREKGKGKEGCIIGGYYLCKEGLERTTNGL